MMDKIKDIQEKKKQIKKLEDDIKKLSKEIPNNIAMTTTKKMLVIDGGEVREAKRANTTENEKAWSGILTLCKELIRPTYAGKAVRIKYLTPEELKIAGEMADDIIDVWNKHVQKFYVERVENYFKEKEGR